MKEFIIGLIISVFLVIGVVYFIAWAFMVRVNRTSMEANSTGYYSITDIHQTNNINLIYKYE